MASTADIRTAAGNGGLFGGAFDAQPAAAARTASSSRTPGDFLGISAIPAQPQRPCRCDNPQPPAARARCPREASVGLPKTIGKPESTETGQGKCPADPSGLADPQAGA